MSLRARDRLIESTIELISAKGVAGAGISELLEHSDVSRRTVYVNFPGGKSELITAAAKSAGGSTTDLLARLVTDAPVEIALVGFGSWWADTLRASEFTRGCPIVAATLGRAEAPRAADAARGTFASWVDLIRVRLEKDGLDPAQSHSLASTIVAAVEGAVLMCLAERSTEPLDRVIEQLVRWVGNQTGRNHTAL